MLVEPGLFAASRGAHAARVVLTAVQQAQESLPEFRVESIYDGVQGGVAPAKPHKHIESGVADAVRSLSAIGGLRTGAEGGGAVQEEEGEPAEDKDAHNDAESFENFGLLPDGDPECAVGIGVVMTDMFMVIRPVRTPLTRCAQKLRCVNMRVEMATVGMLSCTLQRANPLDLNLGYLVDACVCDHHDGHWDVETDE